jgi:peptide/nickel transport system substrate-binding protein
VSGVELPSGTVTFLFTDIEGSTGLLKQLGGGPYGEVLREHQQILREAAKEHGGREVDTQGDSFFFAFPRANQALAAAVVAQRALAEHEWPAGSDVRVRMGLHTGEPEVGEERYVGLGVHRAARIGTAAHGGQVLLSGATRELVEEEKAGVVVRELGSYRLKDIDRPERLYQLDIDGLQMAFPPLRAEKAAEPRPPRRRAILLTALAGVIAAAVAIPIFAFGQGGGGGGGSVETAAGDSLGVVDSGSGRLVADVGVGATPTRIAYGDGSYWVTNADGHSVSRIDAASNRQVDTIPVGNGPGGIAFGNGAVWVANSLDGTVSRIDPGTNAVVQTIDVGNGPIGVLYAAGSVWVANSGDGTITKINPATGKASKPIQIAATELAYGAGTVWASQHDSSRVVRIDPASSEVVAALQVGNGPSGIAFGDGAAWVANSLDGTVSRIDPATNSIASVIPVGNGPTGIAVDSHGVWVSNQFGGNLARIDTRTNQSSRSISVGNRPQGITAAGGNVLVALRASGAGHRGGTLTLRSDLPPHSQPLDSIDSAVSYSTVVWPLLKMTGDGLVAYDQTSGLAGTQLVPDLAVSLPAPTDGGTTYTFQLRPGIRYSNGKPVKASDFRSTIERDLQIGSPVSFYAGIVGAAECKPKKPCDLSGGIVADDAARTVRFHLTAPDPEFLYKLAVPFAYVVPAGTPPRDTGTHPLPATGPYMIASYRPKSLLKLVRNPYFREWSQAAQPDGYPNEIDLRIGGTSDAALDDVLQGRADVAWTVDPYSPGQLTRVETQYASQAHRNPTPSTQALFLNTRVPPFNNLDVRRAVNYAADRRAMSQAMGGSGQPTCQILPANFPGYHAYCPYTTGSTTSGTWTGPDLAKARALVARSGTRDVKVTVWAWTQADPFNTFATKLLRSLGYRVSTKNVSGGYTYFSTVADSRNRAQIGFGGWSADYPAPSDFFVGLFSCASFHPADPNANTNTSEFCDPAIDREMRQALAKQMTDPQAAQQLWQQIDHQIVDQAPWVPLFTPQNLDVLSKRVGNYQFNPSGPSVLVDQLWVR